MKTKLLKKLRKLGRNTINIHSVTTTNGTPTGMGYSYNGDYENVFNYGDTKEDVLKKVEKIYLIKNIVYIRRKYRKYSKQFKKC